MLVLVAAAGCVDLKASYPERRYYTLSAERPGSAAAPAKEGVLRVRRFTASKLYEGSELVSRTAAAEYETDFYNVFFVPPALQLAEQTQRWLGSSGLYSAVVGSGSSLPETQVLEGHMVSLYFDDREHQDVAILELQIMVLRVASDPTAVVFQKTYKAAEAASPGKSDSIVKAWNAGLQRILAELEGDLAKVDRSTKK
jgi:ABC-type uncharacterized transport system auxiliary subunit